MVDHGSLRQRPPQDGEDEGQRRGTEGSEGDPGLGPQAARDPDAGPAVGQGAPTGFDISDRIGANQFSNRSVICLHQLGADPGLQPAALRRALDALSPCPMCMTKGHAKASNASTIRQRRNF